MPTACFRANVWLGAADDDDDVLLRTVEDPDETEVEVLEDKEEAVLDVETLDPEDTVDEMLEREDEDEEVRAIDEVLAEPACLYISNLFPAPQYSYWFPGQLNEQSAWVGAKADPPLSVLPQ